LYAAANLFPSTNPKIVHDIWFLIILAMVVASCVFYFGSLGRFDWSRRVPGIIASGLFGVSLVLLLALSGDILQVKPATAAFLARVLVIGLFGGLSGVLAWSLALAFNRSA
jgi:hypothetical protein